MSEEAVIAVFEPSDTQLLAGSAQSLLLTENPGLASALSAIFPYLLFIDNVLEMATWTNKDPYANVLMLAAYSVLVYYWHVLSTLLLPTLVALAFSALVWNTSSIVHDSRFNEKPTIDEVLRTLHNITVRFELLLRPAKHLNLSRHNYASMLLGALLFTPVQVFLLKFVVLPPTFVWALGIVALSYHSPFLFATRRLLWRSAYLRQAVVHLTGLDIRLKRVAQPARRAQDTISRTQSPLLLQSKPTSEPTLDSVPMVNNFTIVKKKIVSSTRLQQVVRFDILENERRWIGLGWSKHLLPHDRAGFCYEPLMAAAPDPFSSEPFEFPVYLNDLYTYNWQWMDDLWQINKEYQHTKSDSGWVFYDKSWENPEPSDGFSRYTRSRLWTRHAILMIDKQAEVQDASLEV